MVLSGVTAVSHGRGGRKLSQQHTLVSKTKGEKPERRNPAPYSKREHHTNLSAKLLSL